MDFPFVLALVGSGGLLLSLLLYALLRWEDVAMRWLCRGQAAATASQDATAAAVDLVTEDGAIDWSNTAHPARSPRV